MRRVRIQGLSKPRLGENPPEIHPEGIRPPRPGLRFIGRQGRHGVVRAGPLRRDPVRRLPGAGGAEKRRHGADDPVHHAGSAGADLRAGAVSIQNMRGQRRRRPDGPRRGPPPQNQPEQRRHGFGRPARRRRGSPPQNQPIAFRHRRRFAERWRGSAVSQIEPEKPGQRPGRLLGWLRGDTGHQPARSLLPPPSGSPVSRPLEKMPAQHHRQKAPAPRGGWGGFQGGSRCLFSTEETRTAC